MKFRTLMFSGAGDEPVKKFSAVILRADRLARDEIIDVQKFSVDEELDDAKTGHGLDIAPFLEKNELIALLLLTSNAPGELVEFQVRAELGHHGKAAFHLSSCSGDGNSGHEISQSSRRAVNPP